MSERYGGWVARFCALSSGMISAVNTRPTANRVFERALVRRWSGDRTAESRCWSVDITTTVPIFCGVCPGEPSFGGVECMTQDPDLRKIDCPIHYNRANIDLHHPTQRVLITSNFVIAE